MIYKLKNPKTENYLRFKNFILSNNLPLYYQKNTGNAITGLDTPVFTHGFLHRASDKELKFSHFSNYCQTAASTILEILSFNQIDIHLFYRIAANLVMPKPSKIRTCWHTDHDHPHTNMLVYLTNSGGKTFVGSEEHLPEEDDVVIFDGMIEHCHETPENDRRVVLVSTFLRK